jgi:hypothetical protein
MKCRRLCLCVVIFKPYSVRHVTGRVRRFIQRKIATPWSEMLVRPPTRIQSRPRYPKKTNVKHSLCWEERAGQDETSRQRDRGLEQLRVKCLVSLCLFERPASQPFSKPASQPATGSTHGFSACGRAQEFTKNRC